MQVRRTVELRFGNFCQHGIIEFVEVSCCESDRRSEARLAGLRRPRPADQAPVQRVQGRCGQSRALLSTLSRLQARVKWRQKQCLDFALLMRAAAPRAANYMQVPVSLCTTAGPSLLQLEDDVTASVGYLDSIRAFVADTVRV